MKKIFMGLFLAVTVLTLTLSGCAAGNPQGTTSPPSSSQQKSQDLMADIKAASWESVTGSPDDDYVLSVRHFAANLLYESIKNEGNVMVSPASVLLALAMTLNGADGETRDAMLKALAAQGLDVADINESSRRWSAALSRTGEKTTLSIANSIWFRQGFEPDLAFLQTNADFFKAGAKALDFNDDASADVINGWVNDATSGTIKKIIEKIPATTVMYLINAVYFKSDWQTPFLPQETFKQTFSAPGGGMETDFMHRTDKITYFAGNSAAGVALPYDDGQFVFFALLPEDGASPRDWLAGQDPGTLFSGIAALMAQKANFTVSLAMPKFETSYEDQLNDELTSLGMGVAFGGGADLSLLSANRSHDLYISEVKHKTFIKVDEKGTEAAAVTSVAIDGCAIVSDVDISFDRPFLYGILDRETSIPLFVGILENPAAD